MIFVQDTSSTLKKHNFGKVPAVTITSKNPHPETLLKSRKINSFISD
jgi:hypothetical protein